MRDNTEKQQLRKYKKKGKEDMHDDDDKKNI